MKTFDRIRKALADKLDIKVEGVTPDTRLDSLNIDSLDKVELLFALEDEFGIRDIPYRDIPLDTVGDLVAVVDRLVAEQQGSIAAAGG